MKSVLMKFWVFIDTYLSRPIILNSITVQSLQPRLLLKVIIMSIIPVYRPYRIIRGYRPTK